MSTQYINEPPTYGKVILKTTAGEIEIELWSKECPLACRNFVQLCMEGYYNGTIFHRLVRDFILQGGDPTGTGKGGESIYGKPFKDEIHQRLRFTRRGLVGMANAGRDDNGSQFFFTLGNEGLKSLDRKHTLFGKITGPTVFNMLKMTECDVDSNDKPKTIHKIIGAEILNNPFKDIEPREKRKKEKKRDKEKEKKPVETKKLNLLSFGDEAEEDEEELIKVNKKLNAKGKSAHDVLQDEKLSSQVAVTKDEMEDYDPEEDEDREKKTSAALDEIRAKFAKRRKMDQEEAGEDEERDIDFEKMLAEQRAQEEQEQIESMQAELKRMQKIYKKSLRPEKEAKKAEPEEQQSEAMQMYTALKFKFQKKSKNLLKLKDPNRESQTMAILEKFTQKLDDTTQTDILHDKKPNKSSATEEEDVFETVAKEQAQREKEQREREEEEEKKWGVDLDAEDVDGSDWMNHKFVAEDEDPKVTKAKDANMKEENDEWYELNDPRNLINRRRRGDV